MKKRDLQQEGFNPEVMEQKVYIVDNTMKTYVLITPEIYHNIVNGNMRFWEGSNKEQFKVKLI